MAEEQEQEQEDKRFYFVKPSVPGGPIDAYPGSRVFSQPSWEWLLERYLRRVHVLSAVGKPAADAYLGGRRGVYRLRRLLSAGVVGPEGPRCGGVPDPPPVPLPTGTLRTAEPVYSSPRPVGYAPRDLASLVPSLALSPPSCEWAVPGPLSDVVSEVSLDASAAETLRVSHASGPGGEGGQADEFSLSDSIEPGDALPLSRHPFFHVLGDFRLDDEPDVARVPAWDARTGEWASRRVHVPSAVRAVRADATEHGESRVLYGSGAGARMALVFQGGLSSVTSETALPCALNLDVSAFEADRDAGFDPDGGSYFSNAYPPFERGGKAGLADVVGVALDLPPPSRGGVGVVSGSSRLREEDEPDETPDPPPVIWLRIARSPGWDGAATWWGGPGGFPHADPAPASDAEADQVEALSAAQPCVPPAFAGGLAGVPAEDEEDGGELRARLFAGGVRDFAGAPLPALCPAEASRHMDALVTTVHRVDRVFAFVSARETVSGDEKLAWLNTPGDSGSRSGEYRKSAVTSGSYCGGFPGLLGFAPKPGAVSASYRDHGESGGGGASRAEGVTTGVFSKSRTVSCAASGLVCLASPAPAGVSVRVSESWRYSSGSSSETSSETGSAVHDPPPDSALLLPPSVLQWVRDASLYAVFDVVSVPSGTRRKTYYARTGEGSEETASGRREARRRVSVVKVGDLDPATGAAPALDVAGLAASVDPLSSVPPSDLAVADTVLRNRVLGMRADSSTDFGSSPSVTETSVDTVPPDTADPSVSLVGLYLVVNWDFDTESPPEAPPEAAGLSLSAAGVRLRFDAASEALSRADYAVASFAASAASAASALDGLRDVLDDPAARSSALDSMRRAVSDAQDALAGAEAALADAEAALADAEAAVDRGDEGAEGALSAALAALAAAEDARAGAEAALADAEAALAEAEASGAVADAQDALAEAQDALAEAQDALAEAQDALAEAQDVRDGALSDARDAVRAMEDGLSAATLAAAEAAVSGLEAAVSGLEAAVGSLREDQVDVDAAVAAARAAVWACV